MEIILPIIMLLGAVGLFLFGMKTMSDALQRASGQRLYAQLNRVAGSPFRGILLATTATAIIQSSSAMTVMIVGLTHAGLLNLSQAIGMVMGANIGTTATAWLVALFGIQPDFNLLATPLIAIAFPLLLTKRVRLRNLGSILIGLALMLLALDLLRETTSQLMAQAPVERQLAQLDNYGLWSPVLFLLAGTVMTMLLQSSSATTTLAIILCSSGAISLENAMALILGDNIGTTATANIAATMTNAAGKRAALAHLLFNLIATLWALPLLTPITIGINNLMLLCGGVSPLIPGAISTAIALALFHTLLNLITTLLLAGFIPQAVRLLNYLIPDKASHTPKATDGEYPTPAGELGLLQTKYSLSQAMRRDQELVLSIKAYFDETNSETASTLAAKIHLSIDAQYAEHRSLERQIAQLAHQELSPQGYQTWQQMNQLVLRQEMALELCQTIFRLLQIKKRERLWFTQPMRKTLDDLFTIVKESYNLTRLQLQQSGNSVLSSESTVRHQTQLEHLQNQWLQIKTKIETAYLTSSEPSDLPQPTLTIFIELSNYIGQLTHCTLQIAETSQPATPQTR